MRLYYACVIGPVQTKIPIWDNNPNLIVDFMEEAGMLGADRGYDYVFVSTPVVWLPDGTHDTSILERSVSVVKDKGYECEVVLTATLPIGVAGRLGCHYMPAQQHALSFFNNTPTFFGCNEKVLADHEEMRGIASVVFGTQNTCLYFTDAVEMIFLITLCQNYINHSFYKEMSHFCSKNKIRVAFQSMSWIFQQDMTPILVYMIQQMEEAKLDCPILYSCLFRQHYIDIPV